MTNIMLVLTSVVVSLAVGVLIGSGLYTRGIDRRCRQLARLTREYNEREQAMVRSAYPRAVGEGCPLELCRLMVPSSTETVLVDLPTCPAPAGTTRNAVVGRLPVLRP